jgi:hypothetical protein
MRKPYLFKWHRHWQLDIPLGRRWLCVGWCWSNNKHPAKSGLVLYWSPNATPSHPRAWGFRPTV